MQQNITYLNYPKQFNRYTWFKPLLVTLVAFGFYLVFSVVLSIVCYVLAANQGIDLTDIMTGGYDKLDTYSPVGALMSLGSIAIAIPALIIGNRIINYRPFSSYSSARGGFRFAVFAKCFAAALILVALPIVVQSFLTGEKTGVVKFTVIGFIFCTVLGPMQCVAEEYIFRGLLMQMFGSWIKIPVIPIVLQTLFFTALHPYDIIGVIDVAVMGILMGVCAYFCKGLEASCALHIANNMALFYLTGFGIGKISSSSTVVDLVSSLLICCLFTAFVIFADKKLGWFDRAKKDDVAKFNAAYPPKEKTN